MAFFKHKIDQFLRLLLDDDRKDVPGAGSDGYDIVIAEEGQPIDFNGITAQVGVVDEASVPFAPGPSGTLYVVAVRARRSTGLAGEPNVTLLRYITINGVLLARPNPPTQLVVSAIDGGKIRVTWSHTDIEATAPAVGFFICGDSGTGLMDWESPLATTDADGRSKEIFGLATNVRHQIGVRTVEGVQLKGDGNTVTRTVVPRYDPPPGLTAGDLLAKQVA